MKTLQLLKDLERGLRGIMDWLRQIKPSPNVAKCEYMFIGNGKQLSKVSEIDNIEIDKDDINWVSYGLLIWRKLSLHFTGEVGISVSWGNNF